MGVLVELAGARQLKAAVLEAVSGWTPSGGAVTRAAGPRPPVAVGISVDAEGVMGVAVRVRHRVDLSHPLVMRAVSEAGPGADVQWTGEIVAQATGLGSAPLLPGSSIGHPRVGAGTLGCFVRLADGGLGVLSNNHVLANTNRASKGDEIWAPAVMDGGSAADRIGVLDDFVSLASGEPDRVDAAVARLDDALMPARNVVAGKLLAGVIAPEELADGLTVVKVGRTTGETWGRITAIELDDVQVHYGSAGVFSFDGVIEVRDDASHFSQPGDSGSVILAEDGRGVGLLFAGTEGVEGQFGATYASPLQEVLAQTGCSLA